MGVRTRRSLGHHLLHPQIQIPTHALSDDALLNHSNDVYKHCSVYTGQSLQCGDAIVVLTKHYVHRQLNMTIVYFRRDFYLPFCGGGVTFPNLCEAVCATAASSST